MNFDGTQTDVSVKRNARGYTITLPEGTQWSDVDTVIKVERVSEYQIKLSESEKDEFIARSMK